MDIFREFDELRQDIKKIINHLLFNRHIKTNTEIEPLVDINSKDKEVKVILDMPGIKKENIKVNASNEDTVEIIADGNQRKYHKTIDLPTGVDVKSAKSKYNNGILELTLNKKEDSR